MSKTYVLINGKLGLEKELVSKLKTIENVIDVHGTLGTFDFIAKVKADSEEQVNQTILEKIRRTDGVSSTITLMAVEDTDFFVDSNKLMDSILGNAGTQAYVVFHTDRGKELLVATRFQ